MGSEGRLMVGATTDAPASKSWLQGIKRNRFVRLAVSTADWLSGSDRSRGSLLVAVFKGAWILFWMRWSGRSGLGRLATRLAVWCAPPYRARRRLAYLYAKGYVGPGAKIHHPGLRLGSNVFVDDQVVIYRGDPSGGPIDLADGVVVYQGNFLETGDGASLSIGAQTTVHPGCQLKAYHASIRIGSRVALAPNCALYSYDHGIEPGRPIDQQPLQSKGPIVVEDEAWLGTGVIVLSGVRIGKGAVVGAGSVVTRDVPDGAIATGVPARVVKMRGETGEAPDGGGVSEAIARCPKSRMQRSAD